MKKIFLFFMIAAVMCLGLVGCGNGGEPETTVDTNIETQTNATESIPVEEALKQLPDIGELTYVQYNALAPELQQAIKDTFATDKEFVDWYAEIKKDHEAFEDFLNPDKKPTISTEPTEGDATDPTEDESVTGTTAPSENNPDVDSVTFMEYQAMSASEQKKFIASFESLDAFIEWHAAAVQEYKDGMIEFGPSTIITTPDESVEDES